MKLEQQRQAERERAEAEAMAAKQAEEEKRVRAERERAEAEALAAKQAEQQRRDLLARILDAPDDYLVVGGGGEGFPTGHKFVAAATGEMVLDGTPPTAAPRPVTGSDQWLYDDSGVRRRDDRNVLPAPGLILDPLDPDRDTQRGFTFPPRGDDAVPTFFAPDRRRAIQVVDGDLWRAEFDWSTGETRRLERLTDLGLIDKMDPLFWSGDRLYLSNPLSGDGGMLNVSLRTGEYAEQPLFTGLNGIKGGRRDLQSLLTPDGRVLLTLGRSVIHLYDLATGDERVVVNGVPPASPHPTGETPHLWRPTPLIPWFQPLGNDRWSRHDGVACGWLDDRRLVCTTLDHPDAALVLLDVTAGTLRRLDVPRGTEGEPSDVVLRDVFGDRIVMNTFQRAESRGERDGGFRHYTVDVGEESVDVTELPGTAAGAVWLDRTRYVYKVETGALAEIGTWLYDTDAARPTPLAKQTDTGGFLLVPTEPERIVFYSKTRNDGRWSVAAAPTWDAEPLGGWDDVTQVGRLGTPVDLGLAPDAGDAWAPSPAPEVFAATAPRTLAGGPDVARVAAILDPLTKEVADAGWEQYDKLDSFTTAHIDPAAFVTQFVKRYQAARAKNPGDRIGTDRIKSDVYFDTPPAELVDLARVRVLAYAEVLRSDNTLVKGMSGTPEAIWAARPAADREKRIQAYVAVADRFVQYARQHPKDVLTNGVNGRRAWDVFSRALRAEKAQRGLE